MNTKEYELFYKDVPEEKIEWLKNFRKHHSFKEKMINGKAWQYICCGSGNQAILVLSGGLGTAEPFETIEEFENRYQILVPSYPRLKKIDEIVEGIFIILQHEKIDKVHIIGPSIGGAIAQAFAQKYLHKCASLILVNTNLPIKIAAFATKLLIGVFSILPEQLLLSYLKHNFLKSINAGTEKQRVFLEAYFNELFYTGIRKEDILSLFHYVMDYHGSYQFKREETSTWNTKVLILESDNDPKNPKYARERFKLLYPQAKVITFHNGGHSVAASDKERYFTVITDLLKDSNGL